MNKKTERLTEKLLNHKTPIQIARDVIRKRIRANRKKVELKLTVNGRIKTVKI